MIDKVRKKSMLLGLKKATGTINKIMSLIEDNAYCVDVAIQVNAAMGLLKAVNTGLLENHLACCGQKFLTATQTGKKEVFIKELVKTWNIVHK